ncbi:MAG: endonuclease/exonuclease/phosphatase family protein, partial [Muribaculaceae bacterium]|nr:endonuclease/exonuclease/phosphatase family protein [Muribaculaceae bacterium]
MRGFLKLILLILNIAAAAGLLVSAYGGHINPLTTTIPGMMLMLFPGLLLLSVVMLLVDLFACRRMMFVQGFAILLSAPAIWNICPLNFFTNEAKPNERELKVMTYNVRYLLTDSKDSLHHSLSAIIREDPDIVLLQECRADDPIHWTRYSTQVDTLMERYPHRVIEFDSMVMWSKFPIDTLRMEQYPDPSAFFSAADIDIDGYQLTVLNVHLQSLSLSNNDKELYYNLTVGNLATITDDRIDSTPENLVKKLSSAMEKRAEQAILLRSQIDSLGRSNILVAGDFNDIADCWAQRTIMGHDLKSTFSAVGLGPTISYNAFHFYFNIDHMLYGGDIRPLSIRRGRELSSDHYPVTATYAIPTHD